MATKYLIINGPNLNLLGARETEVYGKLTLKDIQDWTDQKLTDLNKKISLDWYQSNEEGKIIDRIHSVLNSDIQGLIINPGAYSHYSYAIFDALNALAIPKVEVHLSQVFKRQQFRTELITAAACDFVLVGQGKCSYYMAALTLFENEGN